MPVSSPEVSMSVISVLWDLIEKNWTSLGILAVVVTIFVKLIRKFDKLDNSGLKKSVADLDSKLTDIGKEVSSHSADLKEIHTKMLNSEDKRIEGSERTFLILKDITASLEGLVEVGANGPVK